MPTAKTSAFQTGGKTRFMGVSLGSPGAGEYPNAAFYWPGTVGWPGTDLANFQRHASILGRNPDAVRLYINNPTSTTGTTGSAGNYGFITPDMRSIANTGAILVMSFKYGAGASIWGATADALNAVGSNATKTDFTNIAQNLKRWKDDTGNTAPIKKIIIAAHHEPSNDGGVAADYKRYVQAVFNFWRNLGLSDGPKPSSGAGSTYAGTWYDILEWAYIDIGYNFRTAAPAATNANNYFPGAGYMRWVFADNYNWAGGQTPNGGTAYTHAQAARVPQPGDTLGSGTNHYADSWKTIETVVDPFHQWYASGPGGFQDVLLGFGEFASGDDLDRFPIVSNALSGARNHTGKPHLKGDWITGVQHWLRGETWTAPDAENNITGTNLSFGPLIIMPIWWSSQATSISWYNTIPFQPGDTTAPTTAGSAAHYTTDAFVALMNDNMFGASSTTHTPPTITTFAATNDPAGTGLDFIFDTAVVAGDSAIVSYLYDFGDGNNVTDTSAALTDETLYSYAASGVFVATVTVTDANGLTDIGTVQVVPTSVTPAVSPYAGAPLIQTGDDLRNIRLTYNPAVLDLEAYTAVGNGTRVVATSGSAQTLIDSRYYRFQDITLTANCTITLPASPVTGMMLRVIVRQDGTGSRTLAWTHGSAIKWPAATAPTQTTTASTSDEYEFECVTAGTWRGRRVVADVR